MCLPIGLSLQSRDHLCLFRAWQGHSSVQWKLSASMAGTYYWELLSLLLKTPASSWIGGQVGVEEDQESWWDRTSSRCTGPLCWPGGASLLETPKAFTSPLLMASLCFFLCETAASQQVKAHCSQICNVWLCVPKPFLFGSNLPCAFSSSGALKTSSAFLCLSPTCGFLSDALCTSLYWCSGMWCILEEFQV